TETGTLRRQFAVIAGHVAFRPGGKALVTSDCQKELCRVRLWDLASGKDRLLSEFAHGNVNTFAFGPDGKKLFVAASDETLRCWDMDSGKERWQNTARARHLVVLSDGRVLCSDVSDGQNLNLWDAATGQHIRGGPNGRERFFTSPLAFAPDGRTVF